MQSTLASIEKNSVQIAFQNPPVTGSADLFQGAFLNLTDAFTGKIDKLADFLESFGVFTVESVAVAQDFDFSFIQH